MRGFRSGIAVTWNHTARSRQVPGIFSRNSAKAYDQMDLTLEQFIRLIELIFICQIPGWTLLLGYFLAKR